METDARIVIEGYAEPEALEDQDQDRGPEQEGGANHDEAEEEQEGPPSWSITLTGCLAPSTWSHPTRRDLSAYVPKVLRELPSILKLSDLVQLEIHLTPNADTVAAEEWIALFRGLDRVDTLQLGASVVISRALWGLSARAVPIVGADVRLLPNLRELELCIADPVEGHCPAEPPLTEIVPECLSHRAEQGLPRIQPLTLHVPKADSEGKDEDRGDAVRPDTPSGLAGKLMNLAKPYAEVRCVLNTCAACHCNDQVEAIRAMDELDKP